MTNLSKINTLKYTRDGLYIRNYTEYEKALKEDYKNTIVTNPDKKYICDPFVGYIKVK